MRAIAAQLPCKILEGEREIHYPGGGFIEARTADDPNSLRAVGWGLAIFDECREIQERAWSEVVRPSLMDKRGGALFLSTPRGMDWFHGLYLLGVNGEPGWESWCFPSYDNPAIPRDEFEKAAKDMPPRVAQQELYAEFLPDGGGVLRMVRERSVRAPECGDPQHRYLAFYDTALGIDWNAIAVFRREGKTLVQVYADRWGEAPIKMHEARISNLRQFPGTLLIDATGSNIHGDFSAQRIKSLVGPSLQVSRFNFDRVSKERMTDHMAYVLESGDIELLAPEKCSGPMQEAVEAQIEELQNWSAHKLPGGGVGYSGPKGFHDDMAVAVMAAAWELGRHNVDVNAVFQNLGGVWA